MVQVSSDRHLVVKRRVTETMIVIGVKSHSDPTSKYRCGAINLPYSKTDQCTAAYAQKSVVLRGFKNNGSGDDA